MEPSVQGSMSEPEAAQRAVEAGGAHHRRPPGDPGGSGRPRFRRRALAARPAARDGSIGRPDGRPASPSLVRTCPDDDATRALDAERLRTSRLLARIRFIGISVAFAFNALLPVLFPGAVQYQTSLRVFVPYWVLAAGLYLAGMRSERMARIVGLDVAFLDMPAAFALQLSAAAHHGDPVSAVLGITYFVVLTLGASFALEPARIVLAAAVGAALEVTLLLVTGADRSLVVT